MLYPISINFVLLLQNICNVNPKALMLNDDLLLFYLRLRLIVSYI